VSPLLKYSSQRTENKTYTDSQSLTSIMQSEEERANESEVETVVDLSLTDVLEEEKLKEDYRSQWNVWRSQVSLLILIQTHERQFFIH